MSTELNQRLTEIADRGEWRGADTVMSAARDELDPTCGVLTPQTRRPPSWVFALGAAVVLFLLIGGAAFLLSGLEMGGDAADDWSRVTGPSTTMPPTTVMTTAVGPSQPPSVPAMEWERLPALPASENGSIQGIASGKPGVVAVGWVIDVTDRVNILGDIEHKIREHAAVWVSVDGRRWDAVLEPDLFTDAGAILDVTNGPEGLVGVGTTPGRDGVVWLSPDGYTWERVEGGDLAGPGAQWMESITTGTQGLVAVGSGERQALVWVSDDGTEWSRVEDTDLLIEASLYDVVAGHFGYLAVGEDLSSQFFPVPVMFISPDGRDWERIPAATFTAEDPTEVVTSLLHATVSPDGTLLVWDNQGGIWLSDNGYEWSPLGNAPAPGSRWAGPEVSWDDDRVLAGGVEGVWVSPDRGVTWSLAFAFPEQTTWVDSVIRFGSEYIATGSVEVGGGEIDFGRMTVWIGRWVE